MRTYCVYILANKPHGTLYLGVTGNLQRRLLEHKTGAFDGFSKKYDTDMLVYYEMTSDVHAALKREKTIKWWKRKYKISLIEGKNPKWEDLSRYFVALDSGSSPE